VDEHRPIAVSPRHHIRLASEYWSLIERAPARDFIVHVIDKREANGLPLMSAEIVIASAAARAQFPLAAAYPLHFRKTYFAARLHGDPCAEFELAAKAGELADLPPPIGASPGEFRTCLIPGSCYRQLSPFDPDSEDTSLRRVRDLPLAAAAGLWRLAEEAYRQLRTLHAGGLAHGDAALQNFIVCPSPLEVVLIDYEAALLRDKSDAETFEQRCKSDFEPLLREAFLLQTALGRQRGELADHAWDAAPELFRDPARMRRHVERLGELA
jgi:hypothetical protein